MLTTQASGGIVGIRTGRRKTDDGTEKRPQRVWERDETPRRPRGARAVRPPLRGGSSSPQRLAAEASRCWAGLKPARENLYPQRAVVVGAQARMPRPLPAGQGRHVATCRSGRFTTCRGAAALRSRIAAPRLQPTPADRGCPGSIAACFSIPTVPAGRLRADARRKNHHCRRSKDHYCPSRRSIFVFVRGLGSSPPGIKGLIFLGRPAARPSVRMLPPHCGRHSGPLRRT